MTVAIRWVIAAAVLVGAVGCSGSDGTDAGSACPEGTTFWDAPGGMSDGSAAETREAAIHDELQNLGRDASDEAITAGVVASATGSNGAERVEIRTSDEVVVTMSLAPQNPGWRVERSTWCAPNAE